MAMPAVGSTRGRAFITSRVAAQVGSAVVRVLVMAHMLGLRRRFVIAVNRHRRPAVLERQQNKQQDGEEATHDGMLAAARCGA